MLIGLNGALATATDLQTTPIGTSSLGQQFTLTAKASRLAGTAAEVTDGTFAFTIDGNSIAGCEAVEPQVTGATCTVTPAERGEHVFAVAYSGVAGKHLASDDSVAAVKLTDATETSISSSSAEEVIIGHPVTFTASVDPDHPVPAASAGTVAFTIDGEPIDGCAAVSVSAGEAICQTSIDSAGDHQVGAAFSGTDDLLASTADEFTQKVIPVPESATAFSRGAEGVIDYGEPVTLTAQVTSATHPVDGGTVDFLAGDEVIDSCENVALSGNTATCVVEFEARGSYSLSASYSGTEVVLGSISDAARLDVRDSTETSLVTSASEITIGRTLTFTASVDPVESGPAVGTGTVAFTIGDEPVSGCVAVPVTGSEATCQTSIDSTGSYQVGAAFSGSDDLFASSAPQVTQTVVPAPGSVTLLSRGPESLVGYGAPVTLTAQVSAAGSPADQGTVDFLADGETIGSCEGVTVASGSATCVASFTQRGRHALTAEYNGTISILGSSSETSLIDVRDGTTVALAADRTSVRVGQAITVASAVAAAHGGDAGEGYVELSADGCEGCGRKPVSAGAASHVLTFSQPGTYVISGKFGGGTWLADSEATPLTVKVTAVPECAAVNTMVGEAAFSRKGRFLGIRISSSRSATVNLTPTIRFRKNGKAQAINLAGKSAQAGSTARTIGFSLSAKQAKRLPLKAGVSVKFRARPVAGDCVAVFGPQMSRNLGQVATGSGR